MRVLLILACCLLGSVAAWAEGEQITPELARVNGVKLWLQVDGAEQPCDFGVSRLRTDIEFLLNTANMPFKDLLDAGDPSIPILSILPASLKTSAGCVWVLRVELSAPVRGTPTLLGGNAISPVYSHIWVAQFFGIVGGQSLTSVVSDRIQTLLKSMINDRAESKRMYPPA